MREKINLNGEKVAVRGGQVARATGTGNPSATGGKTKLPTVELIKKRYEKGVEFKQQIGLYETVKDNENMYIGNQWEGVEANGLPTPVFNILQPVTMHQVASITSDNISVRVSAALCTEDKTKADVEQIAQVVNDEIDQIMETNAIVPQLREFTRNAAVDGDGCFYTWFDADAETGQADKGAIVTEIIENTRVHFGNPNERRVQRQPYIIISRRMYVEDVKWMAENNGISAEDIEEIKPDEDATYTKMDSFNDQRVTLLYYIWRDRETKHIWQCETTNKVFVREPVDTGLTRYPVTWLSWNYVQDCMHGQATITGLKPNQIFINKGYAAMMMSLMMTAFPKYIFDKTRLKNWDPRIGAAIGANGGDMNSIVTNVTPPQVNPQLTQLLEIAMQNTQKLMGVSDVAMGNARPDNTSAIVALQRAAATPLELTKQNLYQSVEELALIYIDMMRAYYGSRKVELTGLPGASEQEEQPFGIEDVLTAKFLVDFDFEKELKNLPMSVKLDVGASSYWSEIASMQTIDNLLMQGKIELVDYLERVPVGYIPKKQELIDKIKKANLQAMAAQAVPPAGTGDPSATGLSGEGESPADTLPIPVGGGNGALQRAIVADEGGMKI